MIPFLNLHEMERILQASRDAGATAASSIVLRLPWEVSPLFQHWLKQHVPDRAERVMARVREMRGGKDNDPRFGTRMTGTGIWAQMIRQRFDRAGARLGFDRTRFELDLTQFRRPSAQQGQGSLF
jgi:DNA repair photolyase